jgi:hypothetical protein
MADGAVADPNRFTVGDHVRVRSRYVDLVLDAYNKSLLRFAMAAIPENDLLSRSLYRVSGFSDDTTDTTDYGTLPLVRLAEVRGTVFSQSFFERVPVQ